MSKVDKESNKSKKNNGVKVQTLFKNKSVEHCKLRGLQDGVDFYINDEVWFYSYKEKFINIYEDEYILHKIKYKRLFNLINKDYSTVYNSFECIKMLDKINSLEELISKLNKHDKLIELDKFLKRIKKRQGSEEEKIKKLKEILDHHFNSDIVLWLKNLPNILFIFEVETSYRNDRARSKKKHSKFFEKTLEYMGFKVFYVYLLPNDEYFEGYKSESTEVRYINGGLEDINDRYSEILDIEEELNLMIQEKDLYKFIDFLLTLSTECIEEIELKFKEFLI